MSRPTVGEVAALIARPREVATLRADDAERIRVIEDKRALLDRIEGTPSAIEAGSTQAAVDDAHAAVAAVPVQPPAARYDDAEDGRADGMEAVR